MLRMARPLLLGAVARGLSTRQGVLTAAKGTRRNGLPTEVDVVVVGGGIIGASAAWHLARLGRSVVVLEQNTLTSGTTWHAAGLVGVVKGHEAMVSLVKWTRDFYETTVDRSTGLSDVGWAATGSLGLARTPEMWTQLQRATQLLKDYGIDHALYGPGAERPLSEARGLHPLLELEAEGVVGALHTPDDGIVNPSDACMRVVRLAREAGASFHEHTGVARLETRRLADGALEVTAVETVDGARVGCEDVLLACGQWTRQVMAYIVIAYVVMAYIVMACIVKAYIVMASIVMAYIVMAYNSYGL